MVNISLEEGLNIIEDSISRINRFESIKIEKSLGRIVYTDILANYDNPPFNRSAIDGYACHSEDIKDIPYSLKVKYELCAGDDTVVEVGFGECVRIMTGAEIPDGLDCCIRQEDTNYGTEYVVINKKINKYDNYCFKGEDYKKGEVLIEKDTMITYAEIGLLASMGYENVSVFCQPRIALISTGDEVIMNTQKLTKSKIYNTNLFLIEARLLELGFSNVQKMHINDNADIVYGKIRSLYENVDIVITTGGVSVGNKDIFHEVVEKEDFKQVFWKLKIQPGTPIMYSFFKDLPIISLSGNPFASLVNFELIVRKALYELYPYDKLITQKVKASLKSEFNKKSKNRRFVRAFYKDGFVYLNGDLHSSGAISSLKGCNCFIQIMPNTNKLTVDEEVDIILI